MSRRKSKPLPDELMADLEATNDLAEDMPDGAWFAMLEDTVTMYNERTGNGYDPNSAVHKWLNTRQEQGR